MQSRRRFLGLMPAAAAGLLSGCSGDSSSPPPGSSSPPGSGSSAIPRATDRRYRYGPHPNQWVDLYLPTSGTKPYPVVVTIHGGGWQVGTDARETVPFAQDLVQDGIAVWNVEYRLVDAGGGWPSTLADVATAIDLLPSAGQPLDLAKVVAFGASAGGHLAAWAVSRGKIPARSLPILSGAPTVKPRGAVAYAAPLDLVYDSDNFGASTALLGGTAQRLPDRYAAASPSALLPTGVPVICLHGDADQVVPIEQSRRYVDRAKQLGDPAELIVLPGIDHPNTNPVRVGEDLWDKAKTEVLKLLGR